VVQNGSGRQIPTGDGQTVVSRERSMSKWICGFAARIGGQG